MFSKRYVKELPKEAWALKLVPGQCETQEMYDKAIEKYLHEMEYVFDKYKLHKMTERAINASPEKLEFVHYQCITQQMYERAV